MLFLLFREFGPTFLPPPASEYCANDTFGSRSSCTRADLFAFQISSGMAIATCGITGFRSWHIHRIAHTAVPPTAAGRLFGYIADAEFLAAINFTFQLWDFFISLLIPEMRTAIMLTHHLAASLLSYCSVKYGVLHYYGHFFLGLTEVSSIFLVVVDLAKYFPPVPETFYHHFVMSFAAPGFVLSFFFYRFLYWWPVSYQLYKDVYTVTVKTDQAARQRPGNVCVLYMYLILNLPLGLLQVYWLTVIAEQVQKVITS